MHPWSFSSWIERMPSLVLVFIGWSILVLLNCYFTPNPYSAVHSGGASLNAEVFSETWYISPAWFVGIVSMFVAIITFKRITFDIFVPLSIMIMWFSGIYNSDLYISFKTYIFDSLMLIFCSTVAYRDAINNFHTKWKNTILILIIFFMTTGAILSLLRPETFGHFGDFSRETRGEVTLWYALGLRAFLAAFACYGLMSDIRWHNKAIWIMPWIAYIIVLIMTFTRGGVLADLIGLFVALLLHRSFRWLAVILMILVMAISADSIQYFVFAEKNLTDWIYTENRMVLWQSHLEAIRSHFFFGMGNMALENKIAFDTIFRAEIGVLAWISQYGILYALSMGFLVFRGVLFAKKLFIQKTSTKIGDSFLDLICPVIVFTSLPIHLLTGYSRILGFETFAYYYAIFYCYYRTIKIAKSGSKFQNHL